MDTAKQLDVCWLIEKAPPCFILLGRVGDIIQVSPCWKAIYDRTGLKPIVIVNADYAPVLDGMSYITPHVIAGHWWQDVPKAQQIARSHYDGGVLVQFWHEPPKHADTIGWKGNNWAVIQSHGHSWGVDLALDPNYGVSMARRCGFGETEWMTMFPVFDRRNTEREERFIAHFLHRSKPLLIYSFTGISSPFSNTPEVLNVIRGFQKVFHLVNVGDVKAARIYDMIGLMERAVGLVTIDSALLHLAPACNVPYAAYTRSDWCRSVPKRNCQLQINYQDAARRLPDLQAWLKRLANKSSKA